MNTKPILVTLCISAVYSLRVTLLMAPHSLTLNVCTLMRPSVPAYQAADLLTDSIPLLKLAGSPPFHPDTVSYLAGSGNYTVVHFTDGRELLTAITLVQVVRQLPDLLRVHKSYAIAPQGVSALRWVKQADGKRVLIVTLGNNMRIAIPRRRGTEVAAELAQLTGLLIRG